MQTLLLGPRLEALATATGCLSPRQVRLVGGMLAEIDRLDRRKTALAASRAVSYTHLDVYKRQLLNTVQSALSHALELLEEGRAATA